MHYGSWTGLFLFCTQMKKCLGDPAWLDAYPIIFLLLLPDISHHVCASRCPLGQKFLCIRSWALHLGPLLSWCCLNLRKALQPTLSKQWWQQECPLLKFPLSNLTISTNYIPYWEQVVLGLPLSGFPMMLTVRSLVLCIWEKKGRKKKFVLKLPAKPWRRRGGFWYLCVPLIAGSSLIRWVGGASTCWQCPGCIRWTTLQLCYPAPCVSYSHE